MRNCSVYLIGTLDKSDVALQPSVKTLFRDSDSFSYFYDTEKAATAEFICGIPTNSENILNFVNPVSPFLIDWLNTCGPYISHFHIHNNDGTQDAHSPLSEGTIHMRSFLMNAQSTCPNASFSLELMDAEASVQWLVKEKIIEMPELVSKGDTL